MDAQTTISSSSTLREAWRGLREAKPGIRIREAATALGTSEGALVATLVGENIIRLQGPWAELLDGFKPLGHVMSLTRNDVCILEHKATFDTIRITGNKALVSGPIEMRASLSEWFVAFAVREEKSDRILQSIQVFDKAGDAVIKIYLQEKSNISAYHELVKKFRSPDQGNELQTTPYPLAQYASEVNESALLSDWAEMRHIHDFPALLEKHRVHRHHALELAKNSYTHPVDAKQTIQRLLELASAAKLPVKILAGNRGNLQIHRGKVRTIRLLERGHTGPELWLNVLDPDFNMHLKMNSIGTAWVVNKPTTEGIATSVEVFDKNKNLVVRFLGLPGVAEQVKWKALINQLQHNS